MQQLLFLSSYCLLMIATLFFPLYQFNAPLLSNQSFMPASYVAIFWLVFFGLLLAWLIHTRHEQFSRFFTASFVSSAVLHFLLVICAQLNFYLLGSVCVALLFICLAVLYKESHTAILSTLCKVTFSLYVSWLGLLGFFYISLLLTYFDVTIAFANDTWTLTLLAIAAIISLIVRFRFDDKLFPLVCAWLMIGVATYVGVAQLLFFSILVALSVLLICSVFVKPLATSQL